jgi:Divergent InlB B-repeat domain
MGAPKSGRFLLAIVLTAIAPFAPSTLLTGCGAGAASSPTSQAAFPAAPSFQVIVTPPAADTGTVTSTPPGISCPTACTASFVQNTQIKLTATPRSNYFFGGWRGSCSGTSTCSLTMNSADSVTAIFTLTSAAGGSATTGSGTKVIAYVFTPDSLTLTTPEFALLANGELRLIKNAVQPFLMTATAHGLVMDLPGSNGDRWPTGNLQSYAVKANGSLKPQGSPVSFPVDQYASSLASDSTYVYAVSDEGIFGFEDSSAGLTPLPPIQQTVPRPCTTAEQNAGQCIYGGSLLLGETRAFFTESAAWQSGAPLWQLSSFVRSQGQLTGEQLLLQTPPSVQAMAGNFVYAIEFGASATFINLCTADGNFTCSRSVLSNGQSLSDGFAQLLISPNLPFLFAVVSDGAESPRVRAFQTNSSGALTEVRGSPFLTGEYYFRFAALDPSGHFLLAVDTSCDGSSPCTTPGKLVAMSINAATGAMSVTSDVEDGQDPYTIYAVPISQ